MNRGNASEFKIEVPAKWILSGEHSVLRGKRALAFPYPHFSLKLKFQEQSGLLSITNNPFQSQILELFNRAEKWLREKGRITEVPFLKNGIIDIQSSIPIGAGLGSSAAICVALARLALWKADPTQVNEEIWIELATYLEDVFHGKSSGLDVTVAVLSQPVIYSKRSDSSALVRQKLERFPKFELYDSGSRGATRECILRVQQWMNAHPHLAARVDDLMGSATEQACEALRAFGESKTEAQQRQAEVALGKAMEQAQNCFETWGLVPAELLIQKQELLNQGALAVKLTGAGLGGFWVALWPGPSRT